MTEYLESLSLAEEARETLHRLSEHSWEVSDAMRAAQVNATLAVWAELRKLNAPR